MLIRTILGPLLLVSLPIGMQDFVRSLQRNAADDPTLSKYPAYRFWLTARDMARVGQFMLQEGKWRGTQVVPAEWIKETTSVPIASRRASGPINEFCGPSYRRG
jgi:CubicO group peptidase (beta-lactamase class C family)